jgi:serine O-acetyltransferase
VQDINHIALSPAVDETVNDSAAQTYTGEPVSLKYYPVMFFHMPLLGLYALTSQKQTITLDVQRWLQLLDKNVNQPIIGLLFLLAMYPEFRSLFYYRIRKDNPVLKLLAMVIQAVYKGCPALYIWAREIGPGLFIQHGFSTVIAADTIGKNCWINQQVTIGFNDVNDRPVIGDNVQVFAGAKVLGAITVGSNIKIGANAVVIKNVPDNCTVVGVPAMIVKRNGVKVHEPLG